MLSQTGTLWHYLGSFVFYTLLAIGLIYGAYWYSRKATGGFWAGKKPAEEDANKLEIESTLALDSHKNVYILRTGRERFLIAASGDNTQLLSKLDPVEDEEPVVMAAPKVELPMVERPWYADTPPSRIKQKHKAGFGSRFVQSVQWLVASRSKQR